METYIFQHVAFEGPGAILPYLESKGYHVHLVKLYAGDLVPSSLDVDFAVLMGGPMSALEEDKYPFMVEEKQLCRELFAADKPVLGVCLGAQIMANAFFAPIRQNPEKEIGFYPVTFENGFTVNAFHWHGETFDIPEYAESIAYSEACRNQGFKMGRSLGLQFHLETTAESLNSLLENCAEELEAALSAKAKYVQSKSQILETAKTALPELNAAMTELLDAMLA
ncbi:MULTISPECIES: type 1 glutamine amidotransferase [Hallerella]|uniref:type 1 glutamine amidotransferase n=1 Tax=Hallerella TaxID=2815788 RepID=UPI00258AF049|nr:MULTISPECIES: type 1 glutamine amidotransferase [Hallerella]MCI6872841.1 type 1 glutamine amidotransferase [Hallerella sp.]MDY5028117.1 type 1 glutamine amidotransferase [Hallerella succinigenes]